MVIDFHYVCIDLYIERMRYIYNMLFKFRKYGSSRRSASGIGTKTNGKALRHAYIELCKSCGYIYSRPARRYTHARTRIIHTGKRLIEKCVILISIRFVSRGVGVHVPHDRGRARGALKMDYLCAGLSREESGYFSFILEILLDLNYPHTPSDLPRDRSALYGANGAVK